MGANSLLFANLQSRMKDFPVGNKSTSFNPPGTSLPGGYGIELDLL